MSIVAESARKTQRLRQLLESPELSFLMESHDGLSSRIAEETGFEGIWASGLCMSASLGVRDSNEASWTQVLEVLEFMSDATSIPILIDGDTGYGNFNNMRRLVRKLEQRGIAGVCIEDKLFPKTNSFIRGETQTLADIDEFCGKIRAGKDTQHDDDFCIVARTEGFIAGCGLEETLKRAEAYRKAGADGILIHSKANGPGEVVAFATEWANRSPLLIVPTTYYSAPVELFQQHKISVVIWANHLLRGAVAAMKKVARTIFEQESIVNVEDQVTGLPEIFRLQGVSELLEAEGKYLKAPQERPNAVILAASRGAELDKLTGSIPKAMVSISGKPILRRLVDGLRDDGFRNITVVAGYKPETVDIPGLDVLANPQHATSKDLTSLGLALQRLGPDTLVLYGDLLLRRYILRDLLETEWPLAIVVDSNVQARVQGRLQGDYVVCSHPDGRSMFGPEVELVRAFPSADEIPDVELHGQWIGVMRLKGEGQHWVHGSVERLRQRDDFDELTMTDLLNDLVDHEHPVKVMYISGHWLDVNLIEDIERATEFTSGLL